MDQGGRPVPNKMNKGVSFHGNCGAASVGALKQVFWFDKVIWPLWRDSTADVYSDEGQGTENRARAWSTWDQD